MMVLWWYYAPQVYVILLAPENNKTNPNHVALVAKRVLWLGISVMTRSRALKWSESVTSPLHPNQPLSGFHADNHAHF